MASIWPADIAEILSKGVSLSKLGVNNWALGRTEAIEAIDRLAGIGVGVLGGDVYRWEGNTPVPTYDNWYCEPASHEARNAFVERSAHMARQYIGSYEAATGQERFVIVPDVSS